MIAINDCILRHHLWGGIWTQEVAGWVNIPSSGHPSLSWSSWELGVPSPSPAGVTWPSSAIQCLSWSHSFLNFSVNSTPYVASFGDITSSSSVGCCALNEWLIHAYTYAVKTTCENLTQNHCIHIHNGVVPLLEEPVALCQMQLHQVVHPWSPPAPVHS